MNIAYITAQLPFGAQETFILTEIEEVLRQGHAVMVVPFRPGRHIFHSKAGILKERALQERILTFNVFKGFIAELFRRPLEGVKIIIRVLSGSRHARMLITNALTVPKGFYAAKVLRESGIDHIHAHWASTPSTMAYIASSLSGIPWSFTAHRGDIEKNNMLEEKVSTASFARVISVRGRERLLRTINDASLRNKVVILHMGVAVASAPGRNGSRSGRPFTIMCPANLIPVKGHDYLIDACSLLKTKGAEFKCLIAGDGPLEHHLRDKAKAAGLNGAVDFLGRLPHQELIALYQDGRVDAVVLPSIRTGEGDEEGIPVALMEAMSYGVPVVSTDIGGTPELVTHAGVLVPQKDPGALSDALLKLMTDGPFYDECRRRGFDKVNKEFNLAENVTKLVHLMSSSGQQAKKAGAK